MIATTSNTDYRPLAAPLGAALLVWFWIQCAMASFRIRSGDDLFTDGGFDGQVKFQIVSWSLLGVLALWLVATRRADLRLLSGGPLLWYAVFVGAAIFSMFVSPALPMTAFRAVQHGIALVLVISLGGNLRRMTAFVGLFVAINWILLVLAVTGFDFEQEWIEYYVHDQSFFSGNFMHRWRFNTAFGHPSWISVIGAVGAVSVAAQSRGTQWRLNGPLLALFIITTILTVSRTAIFGMVLGLGIVALGRRGVFLSLALVLLPVAAMLLAPDVREGIAHYLQRGQTGDELAAFTGRADLYPVAFERISKSLPFGQGFQSGRVNPLVEGNDAMGHAHNLLLEAAVSTGLLGGVAVAIAVVLWLAQICWLLAHSQTPSERTRAWELAAIAAPLLSFCVLDSGFVNCIQPVTFFYLLAMASTHTAVLELQHRRAYSMGDTLSSMPFARSLTHA